jgi:hypothetical protein
MSRRDFRCRRNGADIWTGPLASTFARATTMMSRLLHRPHPRHRPRPRPRLLHQLPSSSFTTTTTGPTRARRSKSAAPPVAISRAGRSCCTTAMAARRTARLRSRGR